MRNNFLFLAMIVTLLGCKSEVDKCVDTQVIPWKERNKKNEETIAKRKEKERVGEFDIWHLVTDELESEVAAKARITCLQATGKN